MIYNKLNNTNTSTNTSTNNTANNTNNTNNHHYHAYNELYKRHITLTHSYINYLNNQIAKDLREGKCLVSVLVY